jgi:hypothetical protein
LPKYVAAAWDTQRAVASCHYLAAIYDAANMRSKVSLANLASCAGTLI